jgi:[protein]-arginine 3-hydroxylase / protease
MQFNALANRSGNQCDVKIVDNPSLEHFWTQYFHLNQPVKIINSLSHWPAFSKWNDIDYFVKIAAFRNVPVELGKTYDDDDWNQSVFTFLEFIEKCRSQNEQSRKAYLAQHDLFDQIPILRKDFTIPDYCAISSDIPVIKAWIGNAGTISTMHTDDKHNLLCQIVGEKLIILAAPTESENLYPYEGLLHNTTKIDAENVDFEKFPLAKNVKFLKLILRSGEMLYIPKLYWHYVRSLSPSISISFWFDSDE